MSNSHRVLILAIGVLPLTHQSLGAQKSSTAMHDVSIKAAIKAAPATGYYSFGFMPGERVADVTVTDVNGKRSTLAIS